MLGNGDAAATGGDDAAAEGSGPTADQGQDRAAGAAQLENGTDDLGDRELASIRLLKPDATGIEQQQHGPGVVPSGAALASPLGSPIARGSQQTDELRAVDLAESASYAAAWPPPMPSEGETERGTAELAAARRLNGDLFSSIAHLKAGQPWGVPKVRALFEATYFAGLRKAGMPEE